MAAPCCVLPSRCSTQCPKEIILAGLPSFCACSSSSRYRDTRMHLVSPSLVSFELSLAMPRALKCRASKAIEQMHGDGKDEEYARRWNSVERESDKSDDDTESEDSEDDGPFLMNDQEREEMRRKIREVLDMNPHVEVETDPVQRKIKMQKLLADYPLVVEEEDPNWPEDSDGRGFKLDQFFDKITIKNVKKEDDEDYDSDKEIVWKDDNYIQPIREITAEEWEDTVFKDFNPLVILVHHRYRRPKENEKARNELERAVQMFWDSGLPSPRCVAIDACVEHELVDALEVSIFPEILFTKAGKILHRDKGTQMQPDITYHLEQIQFEFPITSRTSLVSVARSGDDWSKIMAFFYYNAVRPSCLGQTAGKTQEKIPSLAN